MERFYEIQVEIENKCVLDCIHCSSAFMRKHENKLSIEDLKNFFKIFKGGVHVYFTGGDPVLRKDLCEYCEEISRVNKNIVLGMYTSGNCSGGIPIDMALAKKLKKSGVSDMYFSLYHSDHKIHDRWTRRNKSFLNTVQSIKNAKISGIYVKIHLVVSKANICDIDSIIKFCQNELDVDEIRLLKLTRYGEAIENWDEISIEDSEFYTCITNIQQENYSVKISVSGCPQYMPCRPFENSIGCQAGTNLLYIDSDGNVFPCASIRKSIGNIKEIDKIYRYLYQFDDCYYFSNCQKHVFDLQSNICKQQVLS